MNSVRAVLWNCFTICLVPPVVYYVTRDQDSRIAKFTMDDTKLEIIWRSLMRLQSWNLLTVFLFLSTLTASPALLLAQSDNNEKSSLVVDLDIDQLRASELMNAIDFKNGIVAQFLPFDMEKVKRIYGTAQSPKAIQKLTEMETGKPIPFNFLVQVQYKDEQSAKAMLDSMSDQGSKEVERGGKKFITPEDGEAPPNLLAHVGQNNRFEVGTEGYILKDTRDFLSSSLAEIWRKNSKSNAVRLSIDIESNRKFCLLYTSPSPRD